jgi:peroxiredoxin Q/BCP
LSFLISLQKAKIQNMTKLNIGDKAPNFEALDQNGNTIKLSDYKGKKLVLFFYPKASTPGCTMEACNLRDNYHTFLAKGFDVLGVSADSAKRQQNFIAKNELPFPLLADEDKTVINAFGVWGPKKFMGREFDGIHRTTFVIDEQGVITDIILKVKTKEHAQQLLK